MPLVSSLAALVAAVRARGLDRGACGPLADRRAAAAAPTCPAPLATTTALHEQVRHIEPVGRVEDKIAQIHRTCTDMHHKGAAERHHDRHHGFAP